MELNKKQTIIFWMTTSLLALAMIGGGIVDILQGDDFVEASKALGYPLYFFTFLGIFKIGGGLFLLLNAYLPKQLVYLAYAGFFFDLVFAVLSHVAVKDYGSIAAPIPFLILLAISYWYFSKKANLNG